IIDCTEHGESYLKRPGYSNIIKIPYITRIWLARKCT
ncbi:uncharacterized protein METZ01_LOCUS342072, partial [marine metagenome]